MQRAAALQRTAAALQRAAAALQRAAAALQRAAAAVQRAAAALQRAAAAVQRAAAAVQRGQGRQAAEAKVLQEAADERSPQQQGQFPFDFNHNARFRDVPLQISR